MIAFVLFLPVLAQGANLPRINWTNCAKGPDGKQVNELCYLRMDCSYLGGDPNVMEMYPKNAMKLKESYCDVGIHIRFFTSEVALIQMQVIGIPNKSPEPELVLAHKEKYFGCKYSDKDKQIVKIGDKELISKNRIKLFENRSFFESGQFLCAITIEFWDAPDQKSIFYIKNKYNILRSISGTNRTEYKTDVGTVSYFKNDLKKIKCDAYAIKSRKVSDHQIQNVINKDRDVINCKNYGPLFSFKYFNETEKEPTEIKELLCKEIKEDDEEKSKFYVVDRNGNETAVEDISRSYFVCAAPINKLCTNPNVTCTDLSYCPRFTPGSETAPATLTCKGKKWIHKGEYQELAEEPVCKADGNDAFFYIDNEKIQGGICFTDYNCKNHSKLDYPECKEGDCEDDLDYSNDMMKCKNDKLHIRVYIRSNNTFDRATQFDCNKKTGYWEWGNKTVLPEGTQVLCVGNATKPEAVANMTQLQLAFAVSGFILLCILLTVLTVIGLHCYSNPPACLRVTGKMRWKRMDEPAKIVYCHQILGKVLNSTLTTSYRIVHGLRLLDLLLETETAEPKCWEAMYPFLMRVQGTLRKIDSNVALMFSRYLYLEAKKIIDKHGWNCTTKMTNKTKHKKDLIRVVAIKLLGFALEEKANGEAQKLLQSGFRQLGFNAVHQYPHCGVLWSVISHCRNPGYKDKKTGRLAQFDRMKMAQQLNEVAFKTMYPMATDDVIPEFGSPAEQAAFALGGFAAYHFQATHSKDILTFTEGAAALSYFKGMGASLMRNPAITIIASLKASDGLDEAIAESMLLMAPEKDWIVIFEDIMKTMVYYGRGLDSKKLQGLFLPNTTSLVQLYDQLKVDQQFFEEAAECQLEEMRKWFASNTDMDGIKKKPEYIKDDRAVDVANPKPKPKKESNDKSKKGVDKRNDKKEKAGPNEAKPLLNKQ